MKIEDILLTIFVLLFLFGLFSAFYFPTKSFRKNNPELTNEEVIQLTKDCEENGLIADADYYSGTSTRIYKITCKPDNWRYPASGNQNLKKSNLTEINVNLKEGE